MSDLVIPGEQWALVALVVDAAGATLYVNGTSAADPRPVANEDFDGPTTFGVDPSDQANRRWAGLIDEVRIENVPRSRDWIRACYLNQVAGSTFGSYSPVEGNGVPGMDVDGDGIDDGWETAHFRDTTAADATTDSDGDWFPDLFEFIAGTDPTNPASRLVMSELGVGSGGWAVVKWQSVGGKVYTVERGTNLLGAWSERESGILGTPPVNVYTDTTGNASNANYRIRTGQ
jgi:hypothetical protein